ncbi:Crp/Fnr family transcriptional regulator [Ramlibacter tataouinensis]|uniref:Crp/Fnr family transcriptional regulator n=1 Tax=Ramlibacter tataouinensis TaxID=94132 RepID=UPI0022F3F584|nr:Crp/Fnr family transcriptional regulator [Ramlibacter tataouinensis]WBY01043.1 Crp/Fnr family transcriptional regulator [Ramlibacter tataouinensis]
MHDDDRSGQPLSFTDTRWLLTKLPRLDAFDLLSDHAQAALAGIGLRRHWHDGDVVQRAGEPTGAVLLVERGRLRLSATSASGAEILWPYIGPGKMACLYSAVGGLPFHYCATAAGDCTLIHFEAGALLALMEGDGIVATEIARLLAKRSWNLMDWRIEGHQTSVAYRVYAALQYLATQRGAPGPQGTEVRISQRELAALVGSSRPYLSTCLQQLQEERLIRLGYRSIVVCELPTEGG